MASALIQERGTVSGNQMRTSRPIEDAAQTFLQGTPVMINTATGGVKAWDGSTITNGIAGICKEFGANLATAGVPLGTSAAAGSLNVGGGQTFGSVQNEANASNFSRPYFNDGRTGVILSNPDTIFYGQINPTGQSVVLTDLSKQYGMTKDSDNHWFVDKTKTGGSAVLEIVGFDQWDTARGVLFVFLPAAVQLIA